MQNLGAQNGLDQSLNGAVGQPSFSYGFSDENAKSGVGFQAGANDKNQQRFNSYTMIAGQTSKVLAGANRLRTYLAIQNNGTATIFVAFGTLPNLAGISSLQLPANTGITFESGIVPNNEINVICSTDNLVAIVEGTMA